MALENKLGLTSSAGLAREEERISKKKTMELLENEVLDKWEVGKFSALGRLTAAFLCSNLKKERTKSMCYDAAEERWMIFCHEFCHENKKASIY